MKFIIYLTILSTVFLQGCVIGEPNLFLDGLKTIVRPIGAIGEFVGEETKVIINRIKSEERVIFHLYTRKNPNDSQILEITNSTTLDKSNFNSKHPTRIIIHGFRNHVESPINILIRSAYLKKGNFNVIFVDWGLIALQYLPYYGVVAEKVPFVGNCVGEFTKFLNRERGVPFNEMYLIGHSLGAHVAGFAGKAIAPEKYHTIFALDPAGPNFYGKKPNERLSANDAEYVETINTSDLLGIGYEEGLGHTNFYPNVTDCGDDNIKNYNKTKKLEMDLRDIIKIFELKPETCKHSRSYELFAKSITEKFIGKKCHNLSQFRLNQCNAPNPKSVRGKVTYTMGGEPSSSNRKGIIYIPPENILK